LRWGELDLDKGEWSLRASRTKAGRPHVVPITGLAKEIIGSERVIVFGHRRQEQEVPAEHVFSAMVLPISGMRSAAPRLVPGAQ
jgi:hypothetical protein